MQPRFTFSPDYSTFYNRKIFTCGSRSGVKDQSSHQAGVTCGISNQLYEAITCMAVGLRLGFTQYLLPKFCTNGDWGLCNCSHFVNASSIFDMAWLQKQARQEFGIHILEHLPSYNPTEHEPIYPLRNYLHLVGLDEQAQLVHHTIQQKPQIASRPVVNMGFSFGKWLVGSEWDEVLYLSMVNLFQPTKHIKRAVEGFKQLWLKSAERLVVVHVQIPRRDGHTDSVSCRETMFSSFYELLVEELKIPKRSTVLMIGAGFEKIEGVSAVEEYGIQMHFQTELVSVNGQNQLWNAQMAMTLALESHVFVSTCCESQFASHVLRVRSERGLRSCSSADLSLSESIHLYPKGLLSKEAAQVPFTFPLPTKGKVFTVERCTAKFWEK